MRTMSVAIAGAPALAAIALGLASPARAASGRGLLDHPDRKGPVSAERSGDARAIRLADDHDHEEEEEEEHEHQGFRGGPGYYPGYRGWYGSGPSYGWVSPGYGGWIEQPAYGGWVGPGNGAWGLSPGYGGWAPAPPGFNGFYGGGSSSGFGIQIGP